MSRLLERAAQGEAGCSAIPIFQKWVFCISQSLLPPNVAQAQFVFHQPSFLLLSTASISHEIQFMWVHNSINPRIHASHTNLPDPINDHMTALPYYRSNSVICEFFSAVWLLCYCHSCCCVLLIWSSKSETAKDGYRHVIMSHHDFHGLYSTDIWRSVKR